MSIKKYETLLKTVDLGSLTRASEVMGYTQSAISHMLTSLEQDLGLRLLIRDRSGVRLTEEGRALLPAIREVCQANHTLLRQVSQFNGLEKGTVRVGAFPRFSAKLLPELVAAFSPRYPAIQFELLQGSYGELERWISEGRIDCAFTRLPLGLSQLDCEALMEERLLAVFPAEQPVEEGGVLAALQSLPFIMPADTPELALRGLTEEYGIRPQINCAAGDGRAALALVARGLGASILPELLLPEGEGRVLSAELDPPLRQSLGIAYKDYQSLPPAVREFVAFAQRKDHSLRYH